MYLVKFRLFVEIATKSVLERYYKHICRKGSEKKNRQRDCLSVQISVFKHPLLAITLLDSSGNSCLDQIVCYTDKIQS